MSIFPFIILALGLWRISSLFANESGPANIFGKIRAWADKISKHNPDGTPKAGSLIDGLSCEWCNSIWFGTVVFLFWLAAPELTVAVLTVPALSTCVILIKFLRELLEHKAKEKEMENETESLSGY